MVLFVHDKLRKELKICGKVVFLSKGRNFGKMKYYQCLFSKNKQIKKAHFLLKICFLREKILAKVKVRYVLTWNN